MTQPRINKPYELVAHTSPEAGEAFLEGFAARAVGVTRTVTRQGGYWKLEFTIPMNGRNELDYLESEWFNSRLFARIKMRVGGAEVWKGVVWTMELSHPSGIKRRRSYGDIWNAVRVDYLDTSSAQQSTSWYTDDHSIDLYGRRELIQYMSDATSGQAESAAQALLKDNKTPWARTVAINRDMEPGLYVMAVGDAWTANNKYVGSTTLDDGTVNVSTYISDIITNDCAYLSSGYIQTNTLQATQTQNMPYRAWDLIEKLVEAGDASFNQWEAGVDAGGFYYRQSGTTPTLHWYSDKGVTNTAKKAGPEVYWSMWPGVLRAYSLGRGDNMPGAGLTDARDSWIAEVEMSDDYEEPVLKSEEQETDDIITRQRGLVRRQQPGVDVSGLLGQADDILSGGFFG